MNLFTLRGIFPKEVSLVNHHSFNNISREFKKVHDMIWETVESRTNKGCSPCSGKKRSFPARKLILEVV